MTHPTSFPATDERDEVTRPAPGPMALVRAARVLREVAGYDSGLDPRRGALTAAQAGLLEACAAQWAQLPPDVAARASGVAAAVDAATGQRLGQG